MRRSIAQAHFGPGRLRPIMFLRPERGLRGRRRRRTPWIRHTHCFRSITPGRAVRRRIDGRLHAGNGSAAHRAEDGYGLQSDLKRTSRMIWRIRLRKSYDDTNDTKSIGGGCPWLCAFYMLANTSRTAYQHPPLPSSRRPSRRVAWMNDQPEVTPEGFPVEYLV